MKLLLMQFMKLLIKQSYPTPVSHFYLLTHKCLPHCPALEHPVRPLMAETSEQIVMSPSPTAPVGQSHLIIEALRSYSVTPRPVKLLWTSEQPDAETST
jgi:hypothetical protein